MKKEDLKVEDLIRYESGINMVEGIISKINTLSNSAEILNEYNEYVCIDVCRIYK